MVKGMQFKPTGERDGRWYRHNRGADPQIPFGCDTLTREMLQEPYNTRSSWYPPKPPTGYLHKASKKRQYLFSRHDNRHDHRGHGEYFGNGRDTRILGRRMGPPDERQQLTSPRYLKHYARFPTDFDYQTVYQDKYQGRPTTTPTTCRRYPRHHQYPQSGLAPLTTKTTCEYKPPDIPYRTSTEILGTSIMPYSKKTERWQYSYQPNTAIYPPYDVRTTSLGTALHTHNTTFTSERPSTKQPNIVYKKTFCI